MKRISLLLLSACLMAVVGCAGSNVQQDAAVSEPLDDLVTSAVEISKAIEADPDSAEEILRSHDLTIEQFEEMLYEISADPEQSKAFEAALAE